jgi:GNAT superfamily N-acetyltransferase
MFSAFRIEPLGPHHDRATFSCGNPSLDDFLKTKARKESELGYCAAFVLVEYQGAAAILGYYTLSAHSITLGGIDPATRKKLRKYPVVPTALIGRLARDLRFRGTGAGELLLIDALRRAHQCAAQVGAYAVTVDATDDAAAAFYAKYGFQPVLRDARRLYLPMASIQFLGLNPLNEPDH